MSKFKFHWGHGVMLGLFSFMAFILILIFLAEDSIGDTYDDYYEHSLKYQTETIDAIKNFDSLQEKPMIKLQANGILVKFPISIQPEKGSIYLERGAYKEDDINLKLTLRNGEQLIPAVGLKKGEYDMKLRWTEKGKKFLKKERIEWNTP